MPHRLYSPLLCVSLAALNASCGAEPAPKDPVAPAPKVEVGSSPPAAGGGSAGTKGEPAAPDKCTLSPIYPTKGVHSPCNCGADRCVEKRAPTDPADPVYPEHWVSDWRMYRVFKGYEKNLPPYASPPAGLTEGRDYEVSQGTTYYDNGYVAANGDGAGAMMEHYEKRCLPIFPIDNHFTCSFISLGDTAYFLTYEVDRPRGMPACCLFSPYNHPPRPDFIGHLPYSAEDSSHLGDSLQAYRYIAKGPGDADIWFAYAFFKDQWLDAEKKYKTPQSFYFSGDPGSPPDAPFVSQNYTDFRIEKPDPAKTWALVQEMCPKNGPAPACALFDPPAAAGVAGVAPKAPTAAQRKTSGWDRADFSGAPRP